MLPPLRDRTEDIPEIAEHLYRRFHAGSSPDKPLFTPKAMKYLQSQPWPGNVRELLNVLERAVVLSQGDVITQGDLPEKVFAQRGRATGVDAQLGNASLKTALTQPERQLIIQALESNGWNRQNSAKALGINRTTLYKKMKKYNIDFESVYKHV